VTVESGSSFVVSGCRGSMCVSGDAYRRFGGNTTCYHAELEPGHHLVVDAGTGLRRLQHTLGPPPLRITLLLTHYHWDHIQGMPLFTPLWDRRNRVEVFGATFEGRGVDEILGGAIRSPWWPVTVADCTADLEFGAVEEAFSVGPVGVRTAHLSHPQGVVGFRLEWNRSIVIATDHESGDPQADARLRDLARDADVLIHDAQYTPQEHRDLHAGWGHSDWEGATTMAREANVGRLVLTSHDPDRTDDGVDAIRAEARALFSRTDAAFEGMTIPF
jgi:ribonuclease BN (tRNA processing enzyme)